MMRVSKQDLVRVLHAAKLVWKWLRLALKAVLRFFNLLEPDVPYMVLSLSKLSVWFTLGLMAYVVVSGKDMAEIGGALIGNIGSIANYAYRRRMQVHTGTGAYGGYSDPDDYPYDDEENQGPDLDEPHPGPMVTGNTDPSEPQ